MSAFASQNCPALTPGSTASAGVPRGQAGTPKPPLPWDILVLGMPEVGRCDGDEPFLWWG